jgi:hypothetical protein
MNEMDSLIQGQYSFAVSCWFLLPTANAIRLTDHPRLPGGLSNGFMLNTNIRNLSLYPLPKAKWFYGHSDKLGYRMIQVSKPGRSRSQIFSFLVFCLPIKLTSCDEKCKFINRTVQRQTGQIMRSLTENGVTGRSRFTLNLHGRYCKQSA